ncbi:DUF4157 domain-containing protein [Streptomyces albus]|uniref:eCIS core domain-containing protein n=1 Tax=Streptomyces albus TaxID=1888 RepID=UPI00099B40EE|nr:DUF4157 domain-containing protein [Streptomyces albus]
MRSRSDQSDRDAAGARSPRQAPPGRGTPARGPLTSAEITLIQRLAGPGAVARAEDQDQHTHGAGCGHEGVGGADPATQSALLQSAVSSSPGRPLPGALQAEADAFYQNNFSAARIHDDPVAQRATEALGARAMTVGTQVFLGPGAAADREVIGHELGHVDKNLRGVRETGNDNGAGVTVTSPDQGSERTAAADGAAFAAGAETAPSVGGRSSGTASDSAVQRSAGDAVVARMRSLQSSAGNGAVTRLLTSGPAPGRRTDRKGEKEKE